MAVGFFALEQGLHFNLELMHVIREYQQCMIFMELLLAGQCKLIQEELEYFQIRARHVEYELLLIPSKHKNFAKKNPIQEVTRIALFACIVANLAYYQPFSAISRALAMQLKGALEGTDLASAWYSHHELLVWVCWIGMETSRGQKEYPWFVSNLARAVRILRVKDCGHLRDILLQFFFLDRIFQKSLVSVWKEVQHL